MSDDSKSVFFVLEIEKDGETGFEIGQTLCPVLDKAFGSRILNTFFYPHDPRPGHQACWTCGGDPNSHPSGLTCVCEDGTHQSEVVNLRKIATQSLESFNAQTIQAAKERLGMRDDDQLTPEQLEVARKLKQKLGEKISQFPSKPFSTVTQHMTAKYPKRFQIVLDVYHAEYEDAESVYAKLWQSWKANDAIRKVEEENNILLEVQGWYSEGSRKVEEEKEKTQETDGSTEQWNAHWLRGYLIDIFKLPATADNWNILEAVRMEGAHWRSAVHKIQEMLHTRGDGPTTVEAVRVRLQGTPDLQEQVRHLEQENARLCGIIEGMEKR